MRRQDAPGAVPSLLRKAPQTGPGHGQDRVQGWDLGGIHGGQVRVAHTSGGEAGRAMQEPFLLDRKPRGTQQRGLRDTEEAQAWV